MRELGYVEGKNLVIEWRFANAYNERLPDLASELVQLKVDAIVTNGTPATRAAQKATTTIPIVMGAITDPVGGGFVTSLGHPGGNITGLALVTDDISPKHMEMLLTIAPKLSRVAVMVNPNNTSHATILEKVKATAQTRRVSVIPIEARTAKEIGDGFSSMAKQQAGAVIVETDALFTQQRNQISELALKNRLPSISVIRELVEAGGLMSYGQNVGESFRRAATYVDKILKGARPGDLPVEQPTTFEFTINRKTANALGLTIPTELLLRADKVIE